MNDRKNAVVNFIWRLLERCGAQVVSLVVSIVLARILEPDVYGTIALITIFTSLLSVFVRSGMGSSLIRKNDADDLDYSTVFYFNFATGVLLYILMFFLAPLIAKFYGNPEMVSIIRVSSLTLLASGVRNVLDAYVAKNMLFKRMFFATLVGTLCAAACGLWMAFNGFGIWSLVAQYLVTDFVGAIGLWIAIRWRPKMAFSFNRLKELFQFGWKLLVSTLIDAIYVDIRQLIIGKKYTSSDLAFYNRGNQFPALINTNINVSIDSVLFPLMSKSNDNIENVKKIMRRSIKTSTYIMSPILVGLAATSKQFVGLILTEKWFECIPFLCIFCFSFMFYPIQTANLNALKAIGRSDVCLKLEIARKIITTVIIGVTLWFGPLVICIGELCAVVINQIINTWPNKRLINYGILEQLKDIIPHFLLSGIMGVVVWIVGTVINSNFLVVLIIQVVTGIAIYLLGSMIFKLESFNYVFSLVKSMLFKNKGEIKK